MPKTVKGFSLIEVMMAMVILAVGLLALISMQGTFASGNAQSRQIMRATDIAANKIEEFSVQDYDSVSDGNATITTYPIDYDLTWSVTENATSKIKVMDIVVSWQLKGQGHSVDFDWCKVAY